MWKDTYMAFWKRKKHEPKPVDPIKAARQATNRARMDAILLAGVAAGLTAAFTVYFTCLDGRCGPGTAGNLVLMAASIGGAILGLVIHSLLPARLPNHGRILGFVVVLLTVIFLVKHNQWGAWLAVVGAIAIIVAVMVDFSRHQRRHVPLRVEPNLVERKIVERRAAHNEQEEKLIPAKPVEEEAKPPHRAGAVAIPTPSASEREPPPGKQGEGHKPEPSAESSQPKGRHEKPEASKGHAEGEEGE